MNHGDRPASNVQGSRSPVLAMNGLAATSQPLASGAAIRILSRTAETLSTLRSAPPLF